MTYLDYLCRSRVTTKLLRFFSTNSGKVFTLTTIARKIGEQPNSVRYPLRELLKAGFITVDESLYRVNPDCPIIDELRELATSELEFVV